MKLVLTQPELGHHSTRSDETFFDLDALAAVGDERRVGGFFWR